MAIPQSNSVPNDNDNTSDPMTYSQLNKQRQQPVQSVEEIIDEPDSMEEDIARYNEEKEVIEDDDERYEKEVVVVEKEKKGGGGIGCSCKSCSCYGCLLFIILLVLLGAFIYFRPGFVWNGVKDFLNQGYQPNTEASVDYISDAQVIQQLQEEGSVEISEQELQTLVWNKTNSQGYYVDVEPNYVRIVRDLDKNTQNPLWFMIEFGQGSDSRLNLTKIGFQRFGMPSFLRDSISNMLFSALDVSGTEGESDRDKFIRLILDADENVVIDNVRFDKDKVTIEN